MPAKPSNTSSRYNSTERRILRVLSDGMRHNRDEVQACINDELAGRNALATTLYKLRRKLRPLGQDILCEYYMRRYQYRQVRLLRRA
jgi:hypothetical protein